SPPASTSRRKETSRARPARELSPPRPRAHVRFCFSSKTLQTRVTQAITEDRHSVNKFYDVPKSASTSISLPAYLFHENESSCADRSLRPCFSQPFCRRAQMDDRRTRNREGDGRPVRPSRPE